MNKIYRIVFNAVTGRYVVASEMAKGRKKSGSVAATLVGALTLGASGLVYAGSLDGGNASGGATSTSYGQNSTATIADSTAVGSNSHATGMDSTSLGSNTTASGVNAVVVGNQISAAGDGSIAIGGDGTDTVAVDAASTYGIAIGQGSQVINSVSGIAFGRNAKVNAAAKGTALGDSASVTAANSVALGADSVADRTDSVSVGSASKQRQIMNMAKGTADTDAVNVAQLKGVTTALGGAAAVNADGTIKAPSYALSNANTIAGTTGAATDVGTGLGKVDAALGALDTRTTTNTTNIANLQTKVTNSSRYVKINGANDGTDDAAASGNAMAMGIKAYASNYTGGAEADAMAIGESASATGWASMAVGHLSSATGYNSVALGNGAVADRNNAVSVGSATLQRQIMNMAKGTADTDAVNVAQLKGVTGAIGGGAAVNADGTIKAPSYTLSNANTIGGTSGAAADVGAGFAKVDSALGALNTTANKGFNISADAGATSQNIAPGGTVKFNAGSNATVSRSGDTITYSVVSNPTFSGLLTANGGLVVGAGKTIDMGGNKVTNVADGSVASASKEAVNGGQLYTTNQNVTALDGRVTTAEGKISTLTTNVSTLDGRVTQNTTDIAGNTTSITNLQNTVNNISNGSAGLVQQSAAGANLTVGKGTDGAAVDFADKNGTARKLLKVAAGTVASGSTDAVNGGQLYTTNQNVAQNTADISSLGGRVTTAEGNISTINTKVTTLDGRVTQNTTDIAGNTTSINNLQTTINNISNGSVGLVQQSAAGADLTVGKGTDGAAVDFADKNGKARKLKGVAVGDLTSTSTDAVNGSQLYATNQVVAQNTADIGTLGTRMDTAEGNITTLDNRVTTNEGDISKIKTDVTKIDGRVSTAETNINTLNTNVSTLDGRVTNVEGSVTNITNQLNSGEIGLVQYDDAAGIVTVAKDKAGTAVDFRGTAGARRLKGVAAGGEDEDAVNVSQLKKVTDAIGGGATVNADGSITAPTYYVTNADGSKSAVTNMGDAMSNIDGRVYNNTTQIQSISTQISSGTIGMVQQAGAGQKLTVGKDTDGAEVDFADKNGNARKLTNVADGKVEAGSKDAVNGGQLHAVSQSMASALGGGSVVNADGTVTAPTYTVTNADGSSSQVAGVEGAISNIDNRVYQNTTAITNNTTAISNLSTQISNGEVGLVKQDAATRQITVAKDSDGTSVSVAGTAGDRVVTGVAAAKADNDAVNLGQLKSAGIIAANGEAKSVITYDSGDKSSITMGGEGASTAVTIHNVADGVADHDAVNVSQLNQRLQQNTTEVLVQANGYTDQKIGDVWTGMDKLATQMAKQDSRISQHGAMSMAEAQMASGAAAAAVGNPNGAWSVGLGSEQGHGAISAGYAKPVGKKSQISFGAAFGGDDHSVGVGFAHKL